MEEKEQRDGDVAYNEGQMVGKTLADVRPRATKKPQKEKKREQRRGPWSKRKEKSRPKHM